MSGIECVLPLLKCTILAATVAGIDRSRVSGPDARVVVSVSLALSAESAMALLLAALALTILQVWHFRAMSRACRGWQPAPFVWLLVLVMLLAALSLTGL